MQVSYYGMEQYLHKESETERVRERVWKKRNMKMNKNQNRPSILRIAGP